MYFAEQWMVNVNPNAMIMYWHAFFLSFTFAVFVWVEFLEVWVRLAISLCIYIVH